MAVEGAGDLPAGSRGLYGVCLAGVQSHRKAASDRHRGFGRCCGLCGRRCGDPPPRPDSNPDLKEPSVARKRGRAAGIRRVESKAADRTAEIGIKKAGTSQMMLPPLVISLSTFYMHYQLYAGTDSILPTKSLYPMPFSASHLPQKKYRH